MTRGEIEKLLAEATPGPSFDWADADHVAVARLAREVLRLKELVGRLAVAMREQLWGDCTDDDVPLARNPELLAEAEEAAK